MPELKDAVAAVVARWREYKTLCQQCLGDTWFASDEGYIDSDGELSHRQIQVRCLRCNGTGYVQPAIVKALIEAVTIPRIIQSHRWISQSDYTDRVPRDWEEIGEGALAGVLGCEIDGLLSDDAKHIWDEAASAAREFDDLATLAAVDKALKQMYGGKP